MFDVQSRNADVPRALVRDMYTKSWSAFDRLVAIVPPGGSIGYVDLDPDVDRELHMSLCTQARRQAFQFLVVARRQLPAIACQGNLSLRNGH